MKQPPVTIVIPNWNGADLLSPCLASLLKQTHPASVVVVDNGSVDNSVELIKKHFPRVTVIELPKNRGFAGGVNVGIEHALKEGVEYVALFNNDAVADKDWLAKLVKRLDADANVGIATGKFLRSDKKHLDSTGDFYTIWGLPTPRGRNQLDTGQYNTSEPVFGATGGASLYRTSMLQKIGLFDEAFFAYFEDVDISFRAQLAGWKVAYVPTAEAYHAVGGTSSKLRGFARYHSVKNFLLLYTKDMPGTLYVKYLPLALLQLVRWGFSSLLRGEPIAYLKGVGHFLILLPTTLKKRRQIQRSRKVSVQYINEMLYHHRPPQPPALENAHE